MQPVAASLCRYDKIKYNIANIPNNFSLTFAYF